MKIDIVFSFRNEENNIPELVRRTVQVMNSLEDVEYEMIFVNDDSKDESLNTLTEFQKDYPISIINMSRRFGVGPCVLAGFEYSQGDAVVYMDSDLQDPPELIPKLIEKFRNGAEIVHTTRTEREGESGFKMWINKQAYRIINSISEVELPSNTGDFKLLSRKAKDSILNTNEYDPYLRGLAVWVGYKQEFVYYKREKRFSGITHFSIFGKGPFNEFIRGLTAYSAVPLYLALFIGFITVLISMGIITYSLLTKLIGISAPGASGILISMAFFNGVLLITNGIIGIYISKIYYQVKGRHRYIINSIYKSTK